MNKSNWLFVAFLAVAFSTQTFAGTVYWDIDGAAAGGSGGTTASGTWDQNTTANWSTSAAGDVATDTFFNAGGATPDAVFSAGSDVTSTTASLITINGAVSANSLTIEEGRLTIYGVSTPTLTLGAGGITIATTAANSTNTIGGTVSGSTEQINLTLSADQAWNIATGKTLETQHILFSANSIPVKLSGSANLTINADASAEGAVILGDDAGLTDYTGNITVKGGSLSVNSNAANVSSAGSGTITLGDTGGSRDVSLTVAVNAGRNITNPIIIQGGSTGNHIKFTWGGSNTPTYSGGITMNHDLEFSTTLGGGLIIGTAGGAVTATNGYSMSVTSASTGPVSFNGEITGSGALVVDGFAVLNGTNSSWSGAITVNSGTLTAGNGTLGDQTLGSGPISLASGTTLVFNNNNGSGTNYQNGTVTIASGTATIKSGGSSSRVRLIGAIDLGVGGTGATANIDSSVQQLHAASVRMLGNSTLDVAPTGVNPIGNFYVSGGVSDFGGSYSLTKAGIGTLLLGASTASGTGYPAVTGASSTYGGDTNILAGQVRLGRDNSLPTGTTVALAAGATLDFSVSGTSITTANFNAEIAGLSDLNGGGGTVTANSTTSNLATQRTLTLGGSGNYAFSGNIVNATGTGSGNLAVTKSGSGTQTLGGTNTYTGGTSVSNGTLLISNTGTLTGTSGVSVTGGTFRYDGTAALDRNVTLDGGKFSYNSSNNYAGTLTYTAGTIGGSNISNLNLTIDTGKTMSPGNSTGTMAAGATTWATGGTFLFELNDAAGTEGSTSAGWDLLNATSLNITAGVGEFTLQIASLDNLQAAGSALNFDGSSNYTWLFVDAGATITGFNASQFIFDETGFVNSTPGSFSITQGTGVDDDKLYLNYTGVIPEPSTYVMLIGGLGLLAFLRRRSKA